MKKICFYKTADKLNKFFYNKIITKRKPDFIIPYSKTKIYMSRWYIIPRNKIFNIYLHQYIEPDPDYTLHDHPWFSISFILFNGYQEETIKYGGIIYHKSFRQGEFSFISPWHVHRIYMIHFNICRTLFITGPVIRKWGFHSSIMGWMDHVSFKEKMKNIGKEFLSD